eukprot:4287266-Prymnesium_polylepis.1
MASRNRPRPMACSPLLSACHSDAAHASASSVSSVGIRTAYSRWLSSVAPPLVQRGEDETVAPQLVADLHELHVVKRPVALLPVWERVELALGAADRLHESVARERLDGPHGRLSPRLPQCGAPALGRCDIDAHRAPAAVSRVVVRRHVNTHCVRLSLTEVDGVAGTCTASLQ